MIAPLIGLGLSLLPKIPEIWSAVASLFGKKAPESVTEAGKLAEEVLSSISSKTVSPEATLELEKLFAAREQRLAELTLEEKKLEFTGILGAQEVEKASYQSEDEYVKRTRPAILRRLFSLIATYTFFAPSLIALCFYVNLPKEAISEIASMSSQAFLYLVGLFSIAFTGYNIVRTKEKVAGVNQINGKVSTSLLGSFLPFLKK